MRWGLKRRKIVDTYIMTREQAANLRRMAAEESALYWYRLDDAYYDDILLKQGRTAEPSELPSRNKARYL